MILETKTPPDSVTVHTEKKIKRKRGGNGGHIHIVTEHEDNMYRVFFTSGED
jgi:hypothetical protein